MLPSKEYQLSIPGLADAVAACRPEAGHKTLIQALRLVPGLEQIKLATTRGEEGGSYLSTRSVFGPDGARLHEDHEAWLKLQVETDGGNVRSTYDRLSGKGFRLSKTHVATLYFVVDHGGDESNFTQIELWREDERMDCELLNGWSAPRDLDDIIREAAGYALPDDERTPVGEPRYAFKRATEVARFLEVMTTAEIQAREVASRKCYTVRDDRGNVEVRTLAQMDPDFDRSPPRARRLFDDWAASSAGRSGSRLCDHWVMQLSDWTDPKSGVRGMDLVPVWTFGKKLAEIHADKGDVYSFFGKLQTLDRRIGVAFGWYFFMLHGNRVHDEAGRRALKAAEDGLIVLPEHDIQVLKGWSNRPYGF